MYPYRPPLPMTDNRAPHTHQMQATVKELEALRAKYGSLLTTAKSHEEMAGRAAREGQLRAEEVREKIEHSSYGGDGRKAGGRHSTVTGVWVDCARE